MEGGMRGGPRDSFPQLGREGGDGGGMGGPTGPMWRRSQFVTLKQPSIQRPLKSQIATSKPFFTPLIHRFSPEIAPKNHNFRPQTSLSYSNVAICNLTQSAHLPKFLYPSPQLR